MSEATLHDINVLFWKRQCSSRVLWEWALAQSDQAWIIFFSFQNGIVITLTTGTVCYLTLFSFLCIPTSSTLLCPFLIPFEPPRASITLGQGQKYPVGPLRVHWGFWNNSPTFYPMGKGWVLFKSTFQSTHKASLNRTWWVLFENIY